MKSLTTMSSTRTRMTRTRTRTRTHTRASNASNAPFIIRVCADCKHFDMDNNTCKALSLVNNLNGVIVPIPTLQCRTIDRLCGIEAKLFQDKYRTQHVKGPDYEYYSYAEYYDSLSNLMDGEDRGQ